MTDDQSAELWSKGGDLRAEIANLRDELEDSQLYRGIAENKQRLLQKKVLTLEKKLLSQEKRIAWLEAQQLFNHNRQIKAETTMPKCSSAHEAPRAVEPISNFSMPELKMVKNKSAPKPVQKAVIEPKNGGTKKLEQKGSCGLKNMKARTLNLSKQQRRKMVVKALKKCKGNKGTVDDIKKYISSHTNYIQPKRKELTGTLNGMCRYQMGVEKTFTKIGELWEYKIMDAMPGQASKMKRKLSVSNKETSQKKKPRGVGLRQRNWVLCNHCNQKLFLLQMKQDPRYYRHRCLERKWVTQSLKMEKGRFCQLEHNGSCLRLLSNSEIPVDGVDGKIFDGEPVSGTDWWKYDISNLPLLDSKLIKKENVENSISEFNVNSRCQAQWRGDLQWYEAIVTSRPSAGTYNVRFNDGTEQQNCTGDEVAPAILGLVAGSPSDPLSSNKQLTIKSQPSTETIRVVEG